MKTIQLPPARTDGSMSLEAAIAARRSHRRFRRDPLSIEQISQLCWSAQGITEPRRRMRAAPSAGATFPVELFAVTAEGVFQYLPAEHALRQSCPDDVRQALMRASLNQSFIAEAPLSLLMACEYDRTTGRYGNRGRMYVHMEAGHIAQNIHLQAVALGLASVPVGAFDDDDVAVAVHLPVPLVPLYFVVVGVPA